MYLDEPQRLRDSIIDDRGREAARYQIVYGAQLHVKDGQKVKEGPTACYVGSVHVRHPYRGFWAR